MSDASIEELLAHRAWLTSLVRGLVRDPGTADPVGPIATEGGRVVSTALGSLCFESYLRYGKFRAFRSRFTRSARRGAAATG